uniref:tRNA (guanine(10)-N(2))-methyltransferase n=1 Tax=Lotharella globosa TaxID=91324 RepID=A0A7S3YLU9_9EUKA
MSKTQTKDFRLPELEAIADMHGIGPTSEPPLYEKKDFDPSSPFLKVNIPSDEVMKSIAERSMMMKNVVEFWGEAATAEELRKVVKEYIQKNDSKVRPYMTTGTFAFKLYGFGKTYQLKDQMKVLKPFFELGFKNKVKLKDPDHQFWVFLDHGHHDGVDNSPPKKVSRFALRPIHPSLICSFGQVYFGRFIADGMRHVLKPFSLKTRPFIGPTSTVAELAFVMANQAQVKVGSWVLDPFVGTASLLIASSYFGGMCVGMDRDYCLLHSKIHKKHAEKKDLFTNFGHYGLAKPEIVCGDNAYPPWHAREVYDAIVCDPPYGVRAGARKSGSRRGLQGKKVNPVQTHHDKVHIPSSVPYPVEDVMADLHDVAAKYLVVEGRLVYLLPTIGDFDPKSLPQHPCLELVAHSKQVLSGGFYRRCITIKKTKAWKEGMACRRRDKNTEPPPCWEDVKSKMWVPKKKDGSDSGATETKKNIPQGMLRYEMIMPYTRSTFKDLPPGTGEPSEQRNPLMVDNDDHREEGKDQAPPKKRKVSKDKNSS